MNNALRFQEFTFQGDNNNPGQISRATLYGLQLDASGKPVLAVSQVGASGGWFIFKLDAKDGTVL